MSVTPKPRNSSSQRRTTSKSKWRINSVLINFLYRLAELLLEKESINLPMIMKVLGERPFPMKESLKEYLTELEARQEVEAKEQESAEVDEAEIN